MPATDLSGLAAARLWAASRAPYLATALFACRPVAAPGSGTVAVDPSWRIHADPETVASLEPAELGRLLIHLAGHLVRDHAARAGAMDVGPETAPWWQRCTDAEINDDLAAADLLPPVAADLPRDLGGRDGDLAEAYFGLQPPPSAGSGRPSDCGSGSDGLPRPWDGPDAADGTGLTPGQANLVRFGVAEEIRRAAQRDPGSVPGGWVRWAEELLPSRTDWRRVLGAEIRRAVAAVAGSVDYTYRRPSRRSHGTDEDPRIVLPSLFRPVPEVAVVCDTSGSMDEGMLARVLSEVEAIVTRAGLRGTGVAALAVDTDVHSARRVTRAVQVDLAGGGGTDMGAGIEAALARRPRPEVIVVLTDGYTPWPTAAPRGARVVVGIIETPGETPPDAPAWARVVFIPPDGR